MSPLFRRTKSDAAPVEEAPPALADPTGKAVTPGKGRPTPKRKESQRRRPVEAPPKDNKEARRRMREKMREERSQNFKAAREGDEKYMLPRDRGPVRKLVRDLIDARRNIGPYFFAGLLVVVFSSLQSMPPLVQRAGTALWAGLLLLMVLDGFVIARLIKRSVKERHPESKERMGGLYFYGIMRSLSFRKIRNPKPQVKVGDSV